MLRVSLQEVQARFEGKMYGAFKKELGEVVVAALEPLQNRYYEIRQTGEIHDILAKGRAGTEDCGSNTGWRQGQDGLSGS